LMGCGLHLPQQSPAGNQRRALTIPSDMNFSERYGWTVSNYICKFTCLYK
jgi:hypothetical protein